MSEPTMLKAEELRQQALSSARTEEFETALALYDQAHALATDDESRELIVINKADALIAIERNGPEVQALPSILMRRRNVHHTFLAGYALMYKHRLANETKRAIFYGQIALDAAAEANEAFWRLAALNDLGIVYEIDSQFPQAIGCFEQALSLLDNLQDHQTQNFSRVAIFQNLGYNKLLTGQTAEGIEMIEGVLDSIQVPSSLSDSYIDLCYGYLDLQQFDRARQFGEKGLALASEPRQLRNAHYLLGEVAYKSGDMEAAESHFEELARFYPQFRSLKRLLFTIDLRSMLNLKL